MRRGSRVATGRGRTVLKARSVFIRVDDVTRVCVAPCADGGIVVGIDSWLPECQYTGMPAGWVASHEDSLYLENAAVAREVAEAILALTNMYDKAGSSDRHVDTSQ